MANEAGDPEAIERLSLRARCAGWARVSPPRPHSKGVALQL